MWVFIVMFIVNKGGAIHVEQVKYFKSLDDCQAAGESVCKLVDKKDKDQVAIRGRCVQVSR